MHVREGDHVDAGQILIGLDKTQTLANATIVIQGVDELLARQGRLEAERDNSDQIVFQKTLIERARDTSSVAAHASPLKKPYSI